MNSHIFRELEKNKMDKVASEAELDNAKKRFAEELVADYSVNELTSYNRPIKFKKPIGVRIKQRLKRFWMNIVNVLG